MKERALIHQFVDYIPDVLDEGTLYISILCATVVHNCCCGCGNEVVTPLSPVDWKVVFDGETISLEPSVGNWSFECHSHYWIRNNQAQWAEQWSQERIDNVRYNEQAIRNRYYSTLSKQSENDITSNPMTISSKRRWWQKYLKLLSRWRKRP